MRLEKSGLLQVAFMLAQTMSSDRKFVQILKLVFKTRTCQLQQTFINEVVDRSKSEIGQLTRMLTMWNTGSSRL